MKGKIQVELFDDLAYIHMGIYIMYYIICNRTKYLPITTLTLTGQYIHFSDTEKCG